MKRISLFLLPFTALAALPGHACDLQIDQAWVRSAPPGAAVLAGYAVLRNTGKQALTVSSLSSPQFASVEIHESLEQDGVAKMRRIERLEVPAGGAVHLEPSGKHLMLMGPKAEIDAASKVELIVADCAPALQIDFPVRESAESADQSHEHHHHH